MKPTKCIFRFNRKLIQSHLYHSQSLPQVEKNEAFFLLSVSKPTSPVLPTFSQVIGRFSCFRMCSHGSSSDAHPQSVINTTLREVMEKTRLLTCLPRTSSVMKNIKRDTEPMVFRSFQMPGLLKNRQTKTIQNNIHTGRGIWIRVSAHFRNSSACLYSIPHTHTHTHTQSL